MGKRKHRSKNAAKKSVKSDDHGVADQERLALKLAKKQKLTVQETCDLIAELSESILEAPEKAFAATDEELMSESSTAKSKSQTAPSKMQQMLTLASLQNIEPEKYTAQLAIMSLLAIFKDILPAYRIRLPTVQEMAVKVSKDTKRIWDDERALLQHYQQYLKLLETTWERESKDVTPSTLAVMAVLSLSELLKSAFHFNFRSNLITAVVRQMNYRNSEPVRKACCESIEYIFSNDAQGEVALEAARQVAKLVKDRGFQVHGQVLRTFLALPLRVHVDEAQAAKLAAEANAKKRKRDRETAEIEAELQEGNASVDKIVLARCQSDTLQAVTLTYFRVLKMENLKASHVQELLPPALEGLAKFSHLINIDTVMDLLAVLKSLLKNVEALPLDASLNCVLTAFQTLQGPGKEMKIDQKEYIVPLYSQLPRLLTESNGLRHTETMIKCLTFAFLKRREFSNVRVAAFLKQILTTSLHATSHTSIPLLAFARQLIQRYPSAQQMLENEQDVITAGQYTPAVDDPEHSNPFATSAWELATLKFHLNPNVADQALAGASCKMLQLPGEGPERLRKEALGNMDTLFIPFKRVKKKHPLQHKQSDGEEKKGRNQCRFISSRQFQSKLLEELK
jgi:nucleolar complex protein 3